MKTTLVFGVLLGFCFLFSGCTKNENKIQILTSNESAVLDCLGISEEDVHVLGDYVIVEDDYLIDRELLTLPQLINSQSNLEDRQYVSNHLAVSWENAGNVKYYIDTSVLNMVNGADWEQAIVQALTDWSSIPYTNLSFTRVYISSYGNLKFFRDNSNSLPSCARNLPSRTFAMAKFGNLYIGNWISINDDGPSSNSDGKLSIIRHEVGHTLCFRHSNAPNELDHTWACPNDEIYKLYLNNTPVNDEKSIMRKSIKGTALIKFNKFDKISAQYLYPSNCCHPLILSGVFDGINHTIITLASPTVHYYLYRFERLYDDNSPPTPIGVMGEDSTNIYNVPFSGYPGTTYQIRVIGSNFQGMWYSMPSDTISVSY